jgi:hypothetical protein
MDPRPNLLRWLTAILLLLLSPPQAPAYSLLTHEQLIDLTWKSSIRPALLARYPHLTEDQILEAHAYAYGGCAIQDLGYYPTGDRFFSDLTHYVRAGDFVAALFRNAHNANELAFAIGALSHYVGDTIGHPLATNRAVPIEFPSLAARYGPLVNYGESPHAHVRTEFAFDVDGISKHRFAPAAYLKHIGLAVPTRQLATAYFETYGLGADYGSRRNRVTLRGYRFAVRTLLPRVAYAENLLHRHSFPPDIPGHETDHLQAQLAQADFENGWDQYRVDAGLGTHLLAAVLFILPKVGPLSCLSIKGPTQQGEADYIRSLNLAIPELRRQIARMASGNRLLPDKDLDTGAPVSPGGYPLTDSTYAQLLRRLASMPTNPVPPGLKADILAYYADPAAPIATKRDARRWAEVQRELPLLASLPTTSVAPIDPDLPDLTPHSDPLPPVR